MSNLSYLNLNPEIVVLLIFALILYLVYMVIVYRQYKKVREIITNLTSGTEEIPARDYINMRTVKSGKKLYSNNFEFEGVYIIHNITKNKYFVGKSKNVLNRISSHLSGSGNEDVYADLSHGNQFAVKAIRLNESDYSNINELANNTIDTYDAINSGYNKRKAKSNN